jgi:hypothetical protein
MATVYFIGILASPRGALLQSESFFSRLDEFEYKKSDYKLAPRFTSPKLLSKTFIHAQ